MSLLSKLFGGSGGGEAKGPEPVTHGDFRIFAEPAKEPGGYRINGRIEKDFDDETKVHHLIRADVIASLDDCVEATVNKCRQIIDQQGDRIF